jgi:hypothetical protein
VVGVDDGCLEGDAIDAVEGSTDRCNDGEYVGCVDGLAEG